MPETRHTLGRVIYRYATGARLNGSDRPHPVPRWRMAAWRVGAPVVLAVGWAGYATHPALLIVAGVVVAVPASRRLRRWWRLRRFRRTYIRPTIAALRPALGDAPVRLHVDPGLGNLMPRLARPMSPAEKALRRWYGQRVEPVLRWAPDRAQRAGWGVQRFASPVTGRLRYLLTRPREDPGLRIELRTAVPFLTTEQRSLVEAVIAAKIPAGELVKTWDQVGTQVTATWTIRRRPPARVGYADLAARLDQLQEWEFFLGLGVGGKPVTISLHEDSPHIAISAGSGAGKSVLAQLVAVQVLARGGSVVILDRKGSHRWALGLPGVDYCTRPEEMHAALVRLATLADQRNADAFREEDGWDPGARVLVIAEELNATFAQLRAWWEDVRVSGQPKIPPAVRAFRELLFMGRSAKINVLAVAQLLTAQTTGGPESRENFGVRALARYTRNAWMMLVPEAAMPNASRTLGRWQIVVGGVATETQVCYLTAPEARLLVAKHSGVATGAGTPLMGADQGLSQQQRQEGDPMATLISLRDAVDRGAVPWQYNAARQRLLRARKAGRTSVPEPKRREGMTDLYRLGDLIAWAESELVP